MAANPMLTQANTLGRYEILHELGRGAIGVVYAAREMSTGAAVALKTLDPALLNTNFSEAFLKDARPVWQRLNHRNIVKTLDAGEAGGTAYVVMELIEGESLRKILNDGPLPVARAIQIADEIACGLAYAHEEGVVHRGIKPSNIIVLRSGGVKISDFGIGQLGEVAILSGQRAGYLSCMSPEQLRGDPVDGRSDIFAFGAVFYEMLTRRPPFAGNSPNEIMEKILHAAPPLPSKVNPHVPRALDRIVFSMLAGHPDDRMPGARILLRDLQRLQDELGLGPGATTDTNEPTAPAPQAAPEREPRPRTPDPNRSRGRAPMQDARRFSRHDQADVGSFSFRPDSLPGEGEGFDKREAMFMMDRGPEPERSSGSRSAIFAALALVLAVLAIGLTVVLHYSSGPAERPIAASGMQQPPATAPAPSRSTAPAPVAEAPKEPAAPAAPQPSPPRAGGDATAGQESPGNVTAPKPVPPEPLAAEPSPSVQTGGAAADSPAPPAAAGTAPAQGVPQAAQPTANVPKRQPGGVAKLIIAVSPQGEIYIDGKHYGTTPPITTLDLEPGMHRIEVRSGSRTPYLTYMTVQAGDVRRIRHDFDAKPSRPPN
jgi:eukaryotic-like serine/threonine-protein kinase